MRSLPGDWHAPPRAALNSMWLHTREHTPQRRRVIVSDNQMWVIRGMQPPCYEVHVQGHLARRWSSWLDGMAIPHQPDGTTGIRGAVVGQAALYGLIAIVREPGLTLLAVMPCTPARPEGEGVHPPSRQGKGRRQIYA